MAFVLLLLLAVLLLLLGAPILFMFIFIPIPIFMFMLLSDDEEDICANAVVIFTVEPSPMPSVVRIIAAPKIDFKSNNADCIAAGNREVSFKQIGTIFYILLLDFLLQINLHIFEKIID
jgi:hypothetical protein